MNVAISTPTAGSVKASYTACLLGMVTHYLNTPVLGREDEPRTLGYNLLIGSSIAQQRDSMVEDAIANNATHVLFIDDDMGFQEDSLNLALSRRQQVVLANYRRKAPPWAFTCRKLKDGKAIEVITDDETQGLEEITFGGFGFCLIEIEVLKAMSRPRFLHRWIEHQQLYSTEDFPFFESVHGMGVPVYLDHELTRKIIHIGDYPFQYGTAPFGVKIMRPKADERTAA